MKETHERAEEIQTNTVVFASQIHKEREGGTVNRYTTVQRTLEAFDSTLPRQGSAAELY